MAPTNLFEILLVSIYFDQNHETECFIKLVLFCHYKTFHGRVASSYSPCKVLAFSSLPPFFCDQVFFCFVFSSFSFSSSSSCTSSFASSSCSLSSSSSSSHSSSSSSSSPSYSSFSSSSSRSSSSSSFSFLLLPLLLLLLLLPLVLFLLLLLFLLPLLLLLLFLLVMYSVTFMSAKHLLSFWKFRPNNSRVACCGILRTTG